MNNPPKGMTVKELREYLTKISDDTLVVICKNADASDFSPLSDVEESLYEEVNSSSGMTYVTHERLAIELANPDSPYTADDRAPDTAYPVIVLWPIN